MSDLTKREFLAASTTALAAVLVPTLGFAQTADPKVSSTKRITLDDLRAASKVAGVSFSDEQLSLILKDVQDTIDSFPALRAQSDNGFLAPATTFRVMGEPETSKVSFKLATKKVARPSSDDDLAFLSATELSRLIHSRQLTSSELTRTYLSRLKRYGSKLRCVINLTEDLALRQAAQADQELAAGRSRGPLHGLPYGLKDLFAVPGYPTTWGAEPYKTQVFEQESAVYTRLREAGGVLVAKLSMGALAEGDNWFGGRTESPWDPTLGSSGSSAGSASATAAGLLAFAIGTETSGSIVSPSHNCRVTGLRPTFGSVSRYGAMALSWTMDKVGPICRTADDCAMVFASLIGVDHRDPSTIARGFRYPATVDVSSLRVGVLVEDKAMKTPLKISEVPAYSAMSKLGAKLHPMTMDAGPDGLGIILVAEAAAAFDSLTRGPHLDDIKGTGWPNTFRESRLIPAVELVLADRRRRQLQEHYNDVFAKWDLVVLPNQGYARVYQWNLTGHPQVLVPLGQDAKGKPISVSLVGPLFSEGRLLALASQIQAMTGQAKLRPDMHRWE